MARTLSQIASAILRNVEIPEDSSTTQALADAKAYANERGRAIWRIMHWPEYVILGTYSIPANTNSIALSALSIDSSYSTSQNGYNATFALISAIREGTNPLMPEDMSAIQKVQADLWASTTTPTLFVNRGQLGIALLGKYASATTLSFFGKANWQDLTDGESWVMDANGDALVAGGTAEFLRKHERDENRAQVQEQLFQAEINRLIHERKVQGADSTRLVPVNPWTTDFSTDHDISRIGIDSND